jgi:hypothetical protein
MSRSGASGFSCLEKASGFFLKGWQKLCGIFIRRKKYVQNAAKRQKGKKVTTRNN